MKKNENVIETQFCTLDTVCYLIENVKRRGTNRFFQSERKIFVPRYFFICFPPESTFLLFERETNREPLIYRKVSERSNVRVRIGAKLTISSERQPKMADTRFAGQRTDIAIEAMSHV